MLPQPHKQWFFFPYKKGKEKKKKNPQPEVLLNIYHLFYYFIQQKQIESAFYNQNPNIRNGRDNKGEDYKQNPCEAEQSDRKKRVSAGDFWSAVSVFLLQPEAVVV